MGTFLPRGSVDIEDIDRGEIIPGSWRSEVHGMVDIGRFGSNHHSQQTKAIREAYKKYFMNEVLSVMAKQDGGLNLLMSTYTITTSNLLHFVCNVM
jgi:hypothetical protein